MATDYARLDAMPVDRRVVAAGCAGVLFAALLIGILGYGAGRLGPTSVGAFTTSYDQRVLDDPLELLLVQSDGEAFASLARDPTLARPEVFRTDAEAAYRAQRPLVPYAAWALSLGRTGWVPPALAALLAATFAPYAVWIAFVRIRVGAWPTDATNGRFGLPFVGLFDGLSQAKFESLPYAVLCLVFGSAALLFTRNDPLRIVIGVHLAFSAVMGELVWMVWEGFGRVLLPLNALALVMIVGKVRGAPPQAARSSPSPSSQERWLATSPRQGLAGVVGPGLPSGGASK